MTELVINEPKKFNKKRLLRLLIFIIPLSFLAIDMYTPSFPFLTKAFDTSYSNIQFSVTTFYIGLIVGELFVGPLSDS